ncbi:MarR family winged helix-turn-helix transcriptional regulator [Amycolatopsis suaedae]|uniref:MarR family transcriptional regulator n=1 Tax=Amycolatopsis suaedae TaxID=2510978 RepID=A0A4V2EL98_9PSEU|nr:MarR family transcriptional regulator [Amycolatopsis suaedae]RZQ60815.1 MarR family transcriptional regulator [Amycolatopsis suaedae]
MTVYPVGPGLGTRMRHLLEVMDGDIAKTYPHLGITDYRPRFTPVVRALVTLGPSSIKDLAKAVAVTHSAASQTVGQMAKSGLVTLEPGTDARQRIVHLTDRARDLLPLLDREWDATEAALRDLEAELPFSLTELVRATLDALERRPMADRILAQLRAQET